MNYVPNLGRKFYRRASQLIFMGAFCTYLKDAWGSWMLIEKSKKSRYQVNISKTLSLVEGVGVCPRIALVQKQRSSTWSQAMTNNPLLISAPLLLFTLHFPPTSSSSAFKPPSPFSSHSIAINLYSSADYRNLHLPEAISDYPWEAIESEVIFVILPPFPLPGRIFSNPSWRRSDNPYSLAGLIKEKEKTKTNFIEFIETFASSIGRRGRLLVFCFTLCIQESFSLSCNKFFFSLCIFSVSVAYKKKNCVKFEQSIPSSIEIIELWFIWHLIWYYIL